MRNQRKSCTSCTTISNNGGRFCELSNSEIYVLDAGVSLAFFGFELIISYVVSVVAPLHFGDKFTKTGFRMTVSLKTVY